MFEKFFTDPSMDFETRSLFGDIHYGAGDVGEMLTAVANVIDGDADQLGGGMAQPGGPHPSASATNRSRAATRSALAMHT